jgi:AGCS family alanine or glycine:cation symporter
MAIPNLVAVLLLSNLIVKETRHYLGNIDAKDTNPIPFRKELN